MATSAGGLRFREENVQVPVTPWERDFGWKVEETFWSFFNRSEDPEGWNRRWVVERDVPWADVAREPLSEDAATMIESFFAVESYLPDFAEKGLGYYRSTVGLSHSHINWSYEELKHGRTLQLILERSGARSREQTRDFRLGLAQNAWTMPYPTARQMLIYASFQEKETQRNYEHLRALLDAQGSFGAARGLRIIGRDEAFHHAFYKDVVRMLLDYDEVGTAQDIQRVAESFRMPAQHLMPDMEQRVRVMVKHKVFGKRQLRDEAIVPTIKAFGFRDADELRSVATVRPAASAGKLILAPGPDDEAIDTDAAG
ncbi:MAG: acyl-ACP desaturase [Chloroflexi bacterium]|nr:acyl-ACP desaturase [Chloroflexota bacterium]